MQSSRRFSAVIAPTFRHIKGASIPAFEHFARNIGLVEGVDYRINRSDWYIDFIKLKYRVWLISGENFKNLVAYEFDCIWVDEPGFLREMIETMIAQRAGRGAIIGQVLWTGVVQAPNWYYRRFGPAAGLEVDSTWRVPDWVDDYAPGWGGRELTRFRLDDSVLAMHGSTFENGTLNPDYFKRQWDLYGWNENLFAAQVMGLAVPVNSKVVYDEFDETKHVIDCPPDPKNPVLYIGFDFNVGQMSWLAMQKAEGKHFIVKCNRSDALNTDRACDQIIKEFPEYHWREHHVVVYGDPAGWARSTQTGHRDGNYRIIEQRLKPHFPRMQVKADRHGPLQETRVINTNRHLAQGRLYADKSTRKLVEGWQGCVWDDKGGIKKGKGETLSHMPEAGDFLMYQLEPPIESKFEGFYASRSRA